VYEGISAGWLDFYSADLPFQWVDASDVAPGRYRLGAEVDPANYMAESNEANNGPTLGSTVLTVPGYLAVPLAASGPGAHSFVLTAHAFGAPGAAPVLQIESPPAHGTLSAAAGVPLASPQVVYTPAPGFAGTDTFTYFARDPSNRFPRHSKTATVSVTVPGAAAQEARPRLLTGLRFSRRGRFLRVRGRATRSGVLRVTIQSRKRRLGSCRKRARAGRRFTCRIKLRRHASLAHARAVVSLIVKGKRAAVDTQRVRR
jgi:hypothetical protein